MAHRALQAELDIGLLLPCNVIVYKEGDGAVVSAIDPVSAMSMVENPALQGVAAAVKAKLHRAIETLEGGQ